MAKTTGEVLKLSGNLGGAAPNATTWYDRSRYGNDGTINGATWVKQPSGVWAMSFDKSNDSISSSASVRGRPRISFSCWFNATVVDGSDQQLIYEPISTNNNATRFGALIRNTSTILFRVRSEDSGGLQVVGQELEDGSNIILAGRYYKLMLVFDSVADTHYIYRADSEKIRVTTTVVATTTFTDLPPALPARIGSNALGDGSFFGGVITKVLMETRAVSLAEFTDRFKAERNLFGV